MDKFYTGTGVRSPSQAGIDLMSDVAQVLGMRGWILRSGGWDGCDLAFELGVPHIAEMEIFVPWKGFNDRPESSEDYTADYEKTFEEFIKRIFPPSTWKRFNGFVRKFQASKVHQLLGHDLKTPSRFMLCWSDKGRPEKAVKTQMIVANKYNIPVFNLGLAKFENRSAEDIVNEIMAIIGETDEKQSKVQTF